MRLWRISNFADLTGHGGRLAPGRWHAKGRAVVYCAEHPALALLEMLVHLDFSELPVSYQLLEIDIPDDAITPLDTAVLSPDWAGNEAETRKLGDAWLEKGASLAFRVPSAIVPESRNYVLNPAHARMDAAVIRSVRKVPLDPRLT